MAANPIADSLKKLMPELVDFRRDLHMHPELSWQEHRTTGKIVEILTDAGYPSVQRPTKTGAILDLINIPEAPFVLIRGDIDALPLQDEKTVAYKSTNSGVCHACAHDAHTTTMVGVALLARQLKLTFPLNIRIVFQPAEEPIPSGAPTMIEAGALKDVKYAIGLHMEPRLPLGTISLTPGWVNMQSIRLDLILSGPGGHSARPNETADLLWIASRIIQDSYQAIYRGINLLDSTVVLTFTEINAAQGYNVIPSELKMTGTLRLSDPHKKQLALDRFKNLLSNLESENHCKIKLAIQEGAPACYNDPALVAAMQENLQNGYWLPYQMNNQFSTPGGDDFSYYMQDIPGAMVRFGIRENDRQASLHEGAFDLPEAAIENAVAFFLHQLMNLK